MEKISHAIRHFSFFAVTLFVLWSFLGGHKQYVVGFNSDHIVTLVSLSLAIAYFIIAPENVKGAPFVCLVIYGSFLTLNVVSILFNEAVSEAAFYYLLSHLAYFLICIFIACWFRYRAKLFFSLATACSVVSSIIIIASFIVLGESSWGRMTIPVLYDGQLTYFPVGYESSSDPNVLGYFLGIGILIVLSQTDRGYKFLFITLLSTALLLTKSRSATLAVLAGTLVFCVLSFNGKFRKQSVAWIVLVSPIITFIVIAAGNTLHVMERLYDDASNSDRLLRLYNAAAQIVERPLTLIVGKGIGHARDTMDPHNLFVSMTIDSGVFSVAVLFLILMVPITNIVRSRSRKTIAFSASLLVFFVVISLLYWQVRTYYFVLCLLLLGAESSCCRRPVCGVSVSQVPRLEDNLPKSSEWLHQTS